MTDQAKVHLAALNFMQRALALLDGIEEYIPALHLQYAINIMTDAPIPRTNDEAEAMLNTLNRAGSAADYLSGDADRFLKSNPRS